MTERYFDEQLQVWVTVCRPGAAKGILTVENFRGAKRSRWAAEKGSGSPEKPKARGWTGSSKRKRDGAR